MESFRPRNILLFGATGNVGEHVVRGILGSLSKYSLTVFTNPASSSKHEKLLTEWKALGVRIIEGDITNLEDVEAAYRDTDTVISCLGRTALSAQLELVRLAEQSATVRWFLPSEFGTDVEHGPGSSMEKPNQEKFAIRKFIRENVRRLRVTYVVVGPYFDLWVDMFKWKDGTGGFDLQRNKAILIGDGEQVISFTALQDVALVVVALMRNPAVAFDRVIRVASFSATANEVLREYERQLDCSFHVERMSLDQVNVVEQGLLDKDNPWAVVVSLRRIWATGGASYNELDNDAIGLHGSCMQTLSMSVARHILSSLT